MNLIILAVIVLFLFGGFSYGYGSNGAYPYRGYTAPGIGGLLVILLLLYAFGVLR